MDDTYKSHMGRRARNLKIRALVSLQRRTTEERNAGEVEELGTDSYALKRSLYLANPPRRLWDGSK